MGGGNAQKTAQSRAAHLAKESAAGKVEPHFVYFAQNRRRIEARYEDVIATFS